MKHLVVFLAICMLSAAMVPRTRRESNGTQIFCAPQTPCAWKVYNPVTKMVQITMPNTYCTCAKGLTCKETDDIPASNTFVLKCRQPTTAAGKVKPAKDDE